MKTNFKRSIFFVVPLLLSLSVSGQSFLENMFGGGDKKNDIPVDAEYIAKADLCNAQYASQGKEYEKFLCSGSEMPRVIDTIVEEDLFSASFCPEKKYGHTYVLVDTTEGYSQKEYELLHDRILASDKLSYIAPYDKLSIINITTKDAIFTEPFFSECKPRSGKTVQEGSMYPMDAITLGKKKKGTLILSYEDFAKKLEDAKTEFVKVGANDSEYSQIMEDLYELSNRSDFQPDWAYRKIIIFSDLLQHSDNIDSMIRSCTKTAAKKCRSFNKIKNSFQEEAWTKFLPDFGINPPEVFVYYLNCESDLQVDTGAVDIWKSYFKEIGIEMKYALESSSGCKNKELVESAETST